jgi:serine/threonine protein kinase
VRLPQIIGDYTLIDRLGAGSFGTVYRARVEGDLGFSQEVAVKLVDAGLARDRTEVITSLADEAQFLARLAHPNIVHVRRFVRVDHEFLGEVHLMEMELVRGVPLSRLLMHMSLQSTPLPIDAVLSLLLEAVDALVYAHDLKDPSGRPAGLVHRDLKPDNLLVGHDGRLKVLDFGIAWAEERSAVTTATGLTKGTPLYMSPEQARGEPADPRGDLYALGAIAFECLVGSRYVALPSDGRVDLPAIVMAVATTTFAQRRPVLEEALTGPAPKGRGLDPHQAQPLVELLGRLLAADKDDRAPSASVVAHQLDELASAWKPHLGRRYLRAAVDDLLPAPPDPNAATVESGEAVPDEVDGARFRQVVGEGAAQPTRMAPPRAEPKTNRTLLYVLSAIGAVLLTVGLTAIALRSGSPVGASAASPEATPDAEPPRAAATPDPIAAEPDPTPAPVATSPAKPDPTPAPVATSPAKPDPTPAPRAAKPDPTPAPRAWPDLRHDHPGAYLFPGKLTLKATRAGDGVACTPEVMVRPRTDPASTYQRVAMRADGGDAWSATMDMPYGERWSVGAEYWFKCCDAGGRCGAQLGSAGAPYRVSPAPL